jgi:hypothetical protein
MFTGTMIEDLIKTVEKAEQRARSLAKPATAAELILVPAVFSPVSGQWAGVEQAIVGVA